MVILSFTIKRERVECMGARKNRRSLPPPPPRKIHIGAFFFFIEALLRLAPLTKISVGVHGHEDTRCLYCNKGNTNTWCIKSNVLQKPETATNLAYYTK